MKYIKKFSIYTLIILSSIFSLLYLGISTNQGNKIILFSLYKFYHYKFIANSYEIQVNFKDLKGNLLQGLYFQDIILRNQKLKINLQIEKATLKINLFNLLTSNPNINIIIKNLNGTFNNQPIGAEIDFILNNNFLQINANNFIKFGKNQINLKHGSNNYLDLKINLDELSLFDANLSGNVQISGKIAKNLNDFTAEIIPKDLIFKQFKIYQLIDPKNIKLTLSGKLTDLQPSIKLNIDWQDISGIMKFIPEVTRLKGKLQGRLQIDWKHHLPQITTNILVDGITATLPAYGIKIKPMYINISSDQQQNFKIDGKGSMRNGIGEFFLKGKFNPFNFDNSNELNIYSENLEFIHNKEYHLIGNFNLKLALSLLEQTFKIHGNTTITQGTIDLSHKNSKLIRSKDVVIVNSSTVSKTNDHKYFKIFPDINLRIEEQTRLLNNNLDAIISGKLRLYSLDDHDNTILGEGRITIKHGVYNLSGQKFIIDKGRIIYLPGTLIGNPILDIKILSNQENSNKDNKENYLYIEGTMDKPVIKDSGLIDENQIILHVLNLGNNPFISNIKKKFNLQEFGIQENNDIIATEFKNPDEDKLLLDDKNLVISKELLPKLYLKYLKPLNTSSNKFKLKRELNNNWSIEIESSTEDGYGADLKFYKEIK